jgi:ubiquinone/menaquinone biosynthesis C-methylase UbiE
LKKDNSDWYEIWNRRSPAKDRDLTLEDLVALDGFDVGAGAITVDNWRKYAKITVDKLNITDGLSLFEVGCGSGAFLYAMQEICHIIPGGVDYSNNLISAAKRVMPEGSFEACEAIKLDTNKKYDVLISHSVFQYFDLEYANIVLEKMLKKTKQEKKVISILEVPDLKFKEESEKLRRNVLTAAKYKEKYYGLQHTYYERKWFRDFAESNDLDCWIFDGYIPEYAQNQFRFNIVMSSK